MAAPVSALRFVYSFRDAKGQTARIRVLIGGATNAAVLGFAGTLATDLQALSNAHVSTNVDSVPSHTYGTNAEFPNVEDKAALTFLSPVGTIHRYQVPAPILAAFDTDGETIIAGDAVTAVVANFQSFVYGHPTDTGPLAYVGGIRQRRPFQRKFNIFTKNTALSAEGE